MAFSSPVHLGIGLEVGALVDQPRAARSSGVSARASSISSASMSSSNASSSSSSRTSRNPIAARPNNSTAPQSTPPSMRGDLPDLGVDEQERHEQQQHRKRPGRQREQQPETAERPLQRPVAIVPQAFSAYAAKTTTTSKAPTTARSAPRTRREPDGQSGGAGRPRARRRSTSTTRRAGAAAAPGRGWSRRSTAARGRRTTSRRDPGRGRWPGRRHQAARSPRALSTSSLHRVDQALDGLELDHPAEAFDERHLDLHAVQLEVGAVEDVALDPAFALAVEGRVRADADRRREGLTGVAAPQPAGVHTVGGRGEHAAGRHVRGGEAELPAALVALHHDAAHRERPAERLGGAGHVAGGQAGADVRRRPDLRSAVERDALDDEVAGQARLAQRVHVAGGPVAEAEVGADDDGGRMQRLDQDPVDELLGGPLAISRSNGRTRTASAPPRRTAAPRGSRSR